MPIGLEDLIVLEGEVKTLKRKYWFNRKSNFIAVELIILITILSFFLIFIFLFSYIKQLDINYFGFIISVVLCIIVGIVSTVVMSIYRFYFIERKLPKKERNDETLQERFERLVIEKISEEYFFKSDKEYENVKQEIQTKKEKRINMIPAGIFAIMGGMFLTAFNNYIQEVYKREIRDIGKIRENFLLDLGILFIVFVILGILYRIFDSKEMEYSKKEELKLYSKCIEKIKRGESKKENMNNNKNKEKIKKINEKKEESHIKKL